ncbi:MAG: ABC transporter permease [Bacteroidota bacterium]
MDYRLRIAQRYLISPRRVSLISVITGLSVAGVSLGVAALIVVLSVMNGFYDFVRDLLVSLDPHIRIESAEGPVFAAADSVIALAEGLPHVESAAAYVEGKALLDYEGGEINKVVIVRGVEPEALREVSEVEDRVVYGAFDVARRGNTAGIVLGLSLGQRLGLLPGGGGQDASVVRLLSAPGLERSLTRVFGAPPLTPFEVRGLYELEALYDESHVFIGLEEAQRLFSIGAQHSGVELRLDDLEQAEAVKAALEAQLDPTQYRVSTWYDLQRALYEVMELEKWGAWLILVLIVVVAAFNIVGSLTMVVIEKRRDMGVLQAMGVSRRNIRRIFLLEGALIGGLGTGVGAILGLAVALIQKHFALVPLAGAESFLIRAYPIAIRSSDVALIVTTAFVLCMIASIYPAWRAASVEPAAAVQAET